MTKVQSRDHRRQQGQPRPGRHPDRRRLPDRGRRGQSANRTASGDDQAGTEEPDPGHDLRRDPRWIQNDHARCQHIGEAVLADEQNQRRRGADYRLRPQAGALAAQLPFQPDGRGQDKRQQQFTHLSPALAMTSRQS